MLAALERRCRQEEGGSRGYGQGPTNEAIRKKVLELLPVLVSSAPAIDGSRRGGGGDGACDRGFGAYAGQIVGGVGEEEGGRSSQSTLADGALKFLSDELMALSSSARGTGVAANNFRAAGHVGRGEAAASGSGRKIALTRAMLDVLEVCYGDAPMAAAGASRNFNDGGRIISTTSPSIGPESWPWNSADRSISFEDVNCSASRRSHHGGGSTTTVQDRGSGRGRRSWFPRAWPVLSMRDWGPRLADAAGDRKGYGGGAPGVRAGVGGSAAVVERAAEVVELVLRKHAAVVWKEALSALRGGGGGGYDKESSTRLEARRGGGDGVEGMEVLPICGPMMERICLELPLLDLPVVVHAAVFEAHGVLSLLPCGKCCRNCPWRSFVFGAKKLLWYRVD